MSIKLRIVQECTDEEMAVISAAVSAYRTTGAKERQEERLSGWKFSGRAYWHGLGFRESLSLRNSTMSTWRRVKVHRFG